MSTSTLTAPSGKERKRTVDQPRQDEGYFGPDSVTWRLFSDPSSKLGGVAAVLLQALNPYMMWLFDSASYHAADPQKRAERTARYVDTTVFGDKAHADAAAESVRRIHSNIAWTEPMSGIEYPADKQEWLIWTHNTIVFGVGRAAQLFGPDVTPDDLDRLVREQHIAARLAGIDVEGQGLAASWDDLVAYIDSQKGWMALSIPAAEVSRMFRAPKVWGGNPIKLWVAVVIQDGILAMLPDWAQLLYGIEGRPMNLEKAAKSTRKMMERARNKTSYEQMITEFTTKVDTHPYRKVRAR